MEDRWQSRFRAPVEVSSIPARGDGSEQESGEPRVRVTARYDYTEARQREVWFPPYFTSPVAGGGVRLRLRDGGGEFRHGPSFSAPARLGVAFRLQGAEDAQVVLSFDEDALPGGHQRRLNLILRPFDVEAVLLGRAIPLPRGGTSGMLMTRGGGRRSPADPDSLVELARGRVSSSWAEEAVRVRLVFPETGPPRATVGGTPIAWEYAGDEPKTASGRSVVQDRWNSFSLVLRARQVATLVVERVVVEMTDLRPE